MSQRRNKCVPASTFLAHGWNRPSSNKMLVNWIRVFAERSKGTIKRIRKVGNGNEPQWGVCDGG